MTQLGRLDPIQISSVHSLSQPSFAPSVAQSVCACLKLVLTLAKVPEKEIGEVCVCWKTFRLRCPSSEAQKKADLEAGEEW